MRHITIREGKNPLFILEQEIPKSATPTKIPENVNHIFISDVSGSMYSLLPKLADDLSTHIKKLKHGDTVSFAWFSGEGDYRFVLKGYKVSSDKDFEKLEKVFRENLHTRGTTCFSEVLAETESVIEDLKALNPVFAMTFLTDGYPVVSNYTKELTDITKAIGKIGGKIASSMLVGYGDYYNKELMADMAEKLGGALIHSSDLNTFSNAFTLFLEDSRDNSLKIPVKIAADISDKDIVLSINGKSINLYKPDASGTVTVSPTKKAKDALYILTSKLPKGSKEVELTDAAVAGKSSATESIVKGAYAAAYVLTQKTKVDQALEVLGKLGDVALIERVTNSYTNAEYGQAETEISQSAFAPSKRLRKGRNTNFLPPANAFCLLDTLQLLMTDTEAFFYPQDEAFEYKRIGRPQVAKDGYPSFEPNKSARCPLKDLTWNDTKLNLSVRAKIEGTVPLGDGYKKVGFAKNYPSHIYRNYALVKDGFLNVSRLPVSISKDTFKELQAHGVVEADAKWKKDEVVVLQLDQVPVINRSIAEGKTSAKTLCTKALKEVSIEGELKALRYLRDKLEAEVPSAKSSFTEVQAKFLEANGITKNGFNPPSEKLEATDFYMAKEFELKIKGLSSLPKVDDVLKKLGVDGEANYLTGKNMGSAENLTPSQTLVYNGLKAFWKSPAAKAKPVVQLAWIEEAISDRTKDLATVRREIQETKFAILLGKKWFDEFTSREENSLTIDGFTVNVSLREVRVEV